MTPVAQTTSFAVSIEEEELARSVARWAESHCPPAVVRQACEAVPEELHPVWKEAADLGWLGLHVSEADGGQGAGVAELGVVVEELAHALFPGPLLATCVAAGVVSRFGSAACRERWLGGLIDGTVPAAISLGAEVLSVSAGGPVPATVSGRLAGVVAAPTARVLLAPLAGGDWCLLGTEALQITSRDAMDRTRPVGDVEVPECPVGADSRLEGADDAVRVLATILSSCEAAGVARWCLETASSYAKVRVQFGRPIGQFQAVKHKLADMLVAMEQARAVAWDAARAWDARATDDESALCAAVAGTVAVDAAAQCAKSCVQVLGGIGFTWEHDAHLFMKRAISTRQLLGGTAGFAHEVARRALDGERRTLSADLPTEADQVRADVSLLVSNVAEVHGEERRRRLVEHGLIAPHWPAPWGRDASALEQVVIDGELKAAGVRRPHLGVGAWVLPTLIAHGSEDQKARWVRETLLGRLNWCQLFSEPGAGSDLASLTTRADKVEGGWRITGQKVWTSMASVAHFGVCLARSDPAAPKHDGISYFVVDMSSQGVDVRPLREMTGEEMFSEVFLDAVFVPDDALIGRPGDGWTIARTTLANERVSMSSGATFGIGVEAVVEMVRAADDLPPDARVRLGRLLSEAQSLRLIAHRDALRSLAGWHAGAESSVRKLLGAEHEQRVQELGLELCGPDGALGDGPASRWVRGFLATRCLTIAGGTSEVQRNVMAERILGQPRDPEPGDPA